MFLIILLYGNTLACSQLAEWATESGDRLLELEKDANDTRPSTTLGCQQRQGYQQEHENFNSKDTSKKCEASEKRDDHNKRGATKLCREACHRKYRNSRNIRNSRVASNSRDTSNGGKQALVGAPTAGTLTTAETTATEGTQ
jgi:hypothetical protein